MAGKCKRLFERRQGRSRLGKLRLLGKHITARHPSQLELLFDHVKLLFLRCNDLSGGFYLSAQKGLLHRRCNYVRRDGKVGCLELKTFEIDLRLQGLQLEPRAPEEVECVGYAYRGVVERERTEAGLRLPKRRP